MKKLLLIVTSFIVLNAGAQNVGIGTTTPAYKLVIGKRNRRHNNH